MSSTTILNGILRGNHEPENEKMGHISSSKVPDQPTSLCNQTVYSGQSLFINAGYNSQRLQAGNKDPNPLAAVHLW